MDTRKKIAPLEQVARRMGPTASEWVVVAGLFDPLTAIQAQRMEDFSSGGQKVLAVVLEDHGAMLPADARAILMASLRSVRLVTIARRDEWRAFVVDHAAQLIDDPKGERQRSADFVQFVLKRQTE